MSLPAEQAPTEQEIIDEVSPLLARPDDEDVEQATGDAPETVPPKYRECKGFELFIILGSMYLGVFLAALDGTIVASLLGHIASEFNEFKSVAWIATGYLISNAAFQPLFGKLTDIFGRRSGLVSCNALFLIGCLGCGLSKRFITLIVCRVIQGVGGGGLTALSSITTSDLVPVRRRGVYQGIGNIVFGVGAGCGGILGGILSDRVGWRWAFLGQVPLILISLIAIWVKLHLPTGQSKESLRTKLSRVDFYGSFSLSTCLVFLLFALSCGGSIYPWSSIPVLGAFVFSFIFLILFIFVESKVAKEPVIPLGLLKDPTILGSALTNWFATMSVYSYLFYVPIYMTSVLGYSSSTAGGRLTSNFVGVAIGSFGAGVYMRQTGKYKALLLWSNIIYVVGCGILLTFGTTTSMWKQILSLFLPGIGYSSMLTVTLIALIAAVPHEFQAVTTSIQYAFRGTGSTMGVALTSSLFQNVLKHSLYAKVIDPDESERLRVIKRVQESIDAIRTDVPLRLRGMVIESYLDASLATFWFTFILGVIMFATSLLIREHILHSTIER